MSIEAMKQALEALEKSNRFFWHYAHSKATAQIAEQCYEAITALRKAIQEEALRNVQRLGQEIEQEPVAWAQFSEIGNLIDLLEEPCKGYAPLYTHPQQRTWVGLTNEDKQMCLSAGVDHGWHGVMEATETKLKEKNT